jgi:Na+-transporting NADH:ubiquinone oxidoreductase subunit NqrC
MNEQQRHNEIAGLLKVIIVIALIAGGLVAADQVMKADAEQDRLSKCIDGHREYCDFDR